LLTSATVILLASELYQYCQKMKRTQNFHLPLSQRNVCFYFFYWLHADTTKRQ